jgi:hypothetical protein
MKKRLKDFEKKRIVLYYVNKDGDNNDIQGMLSYVGKDHVNFNTGNFEFPILKKNIILVKNQSGKVLFETKS